MCVILAQYRTGRDDLYYTSRSTLRARWKTVQMNIQQISLVKQMPTVTNNIALHNNSSGVSLRFRLVGKPQDKGEQQVSGPHTFSLGRQSYRNLQFPAHSENVSHTKGLTLSVATCGCFRIDSEAQVHVMWCSFVCALCVASSGHRVVCPWLLSCLCVLYLEFSTRG